MCSVEQVDHESHKPKSGYTKNNHWEQVYPKTVSSRSCHSPDDQLPADQFSTGTVKPLHPYHQDPPGVRGMVDDAERCDLVNFVLNWQIVLRGFKYLLFKDWGVCEQQMGVVSNDRLRSEGVMTHLFMFEKTWMNRRSGSLLNITATASRSCSWMTNGLMYHGLAYFSESIL